MHEKLSQVLDSPNAALPVGMGDDDKIAVSAEDCSYILAELRKEIDQFGQVVSRCRSIGVLM